jgi:hypothetical protein
MDSTFGVLDAVSGCGLMRFIVFAILIALAVVLVVGLGQLPGQLAKNGITPGFSGFPPMEPARYPQVSFLGIKHNKLTGPVWNSISSAEAHTAAKYARSTEQVRCNSKPDRGYA